MNGKKHFSQIFRVVLFPSLSPKDEHVSQSILRASQSISPHMVQSVSFPLERYLQGL